MLLLLTGTMASQLIQLHFPPTLSQHEVIRVMSVASELNVGFAQMCFCPDVPLEVDWVLTVT